MDLNLLATILLFFFMDEDYETLDLGNTIEKLSFNESYGVGKGNNRKANKIYLTPFQFFFLLQDQKNEKTLYKLTKLDFQQFEELKLSFPKDSKLVKEVPKMTIEDKLLLCLMWVH